MVKVQVLYAHRSARRLPPHKHARQLGHGFRNPHGEKCCRPPPPSCTVSVTHTWRVKTFWTLVMHCCGAQRLAGFIWFSRSKARATRLEKIPGSSVQKKLSCMPKTSLAHQIDHIDSLLAGTHVPVLHSFPQATDLKFFCATCQPWRLGY